MNENVKQMIDLFADNKEKLSKAFPWEDQNMSAISAMGFSVKGMEADIENMKAANEIVKNKAKAFSELKGNVKLALELQMVLSDSMESYFDHVNNVYKLLTADNKLASYEYYALAAMIIVQQGKFDSMSDEQYVEKTKKIFAKMKENHPWLTDSADMGFAALLSVTDLNESDITDEMEKCYKYLKEKKVFSSSNGVQSLSQILSLKLGDTENKCDKVISIFEALKGHKKNYGVSYELSALGAFAFADADSEKIANEITEIDEYLKTKKGFGALGISGANRLMYAALFAMQEDSAKGDLADTAALAAGTTALAIAAEVAALVTMNICLMTVVL